MHLCFFFLLLLLSFNFPFFNWPKQKSVLTEVKPFAKLMVLRGMSMLSCTSKVSERCFNVCSVKMRGNLQQNHNRAHPGPKCRQLGLLMPITVRFQMGTVYFPPLSGKKRKKTLSSQRKELSCLKM